MASNFPVQVMGNYPPDRVRHINVTAGQTFITGAMVVLSSGAVSECGADPATWTGIAMAPASVGLATPESIYGGDKIPVFIATPLDTFFVASATTPVYATHIGVAYGVVKSTNWLLDTSETTATIWEVIDVSNSPQQEGFYARPLASRLNPSGIAS